MSPKNLCFSHMWSTYIGMLLAISSKTYSPNLRWKVMRNIKYVIQIHMWSMNGKGTRYEFTLGKITSALVFCPWFSAFVWNAYAINMSALRPSKTINKLSRFNSTERGFFLKLVFPSKCRVFVYLFRNYQKEKIRKTKTKICLKLFFLKIHYLLMHYCPQLIHLWQS